MAITWSMRVDGDVLRVTAAGFDESLDEARAYGEAIIRAGIEHRTFRIFCDEVALEYRLGTMDTYLLATFLAEKAPHIARVAILCQPKGIADARFLEDVAVNRGLTIRAFTNREKANDWVTDGLAFTEGPEPGELRETGAGPA